MSSRLVGVASYIYQFESARYVTSEHSRLESLHVTSYVRLRVEQMTILGEFVEHLHVYHVANTPLSLSLSPPLSPLTASCLLGKMMLQW